MTLTVAQDLFIGGEWIAPSGGREEVINPATEELIGMAPVGNRNDVDQAIASAREAFDKGPWPRTPIQERVAILGKMLDWLDSNRARIIDLIVQEAGATRMLAEFLQYGIPMKHARTLLADALHIKPKFAPLEITPDFTGSKVLGTAVTVHDPIGVVACITPYNFPYFLNIGKLYHALTMGNTAVLKPSPFTPFEALIIGEAAQAVGLPRGVLNIVTGDVQTGELLTTDPRVDMVSFTGSDKVGSLIMAQGAATLKKMHLELGGKSALIIRADANLDKAAMDALGGFTVHSGQGCALTTRMLVHNSIRKEFVERVGMMAKHMKIGNPADPSVQMGPLIRDAARKRSEMYTEIALAGGGTLVCGGKRPADLKAGYFFEPTLFDNVTNDMRIAREEVFGPIGVVIGFDSDEEAIKITNDSDFGLGGGIYSANAGLAYEMATQIRTGTIAINGGGGTMLSSTPFGGIKRSGIGREYGPEALLEFTQPKSISFHAG
ncbi:MAG: aldehyde dehydrogenase family protein [Spongiibacteraceae bacterium]